MPIRENGTSLAELPIPQALTDAAATFVDSLKISSTSEAVRRGRQMVIKRRNIYGEQLADLANLYFRISGIPIRFWSKTEDWKRWELKCFKMLNGDRFRVLANRLCSRSENTKPIGVQHVEGIQDAERRSFSCSP